MPQPCTGVDVAFSALLATGQTLDLLAPGRAARIACFEGLEPDIADRLVEMGFEEGAEVEILHRAPLGDPIAVRVEGATVALRRAVASKIRLTAAD